MDIKPETKAEFLEFTVESSDVTRRLLKLLPSTYFIYDASTHYGTHYSALSQELALLRYAAKIVMLDTSVLSASFKVLYRNFGYMLDFYVTVANSTDYRDFLNELIDIYFLGSIHESVERGGELFSGLPTQVVDVVKLIPDVDTNDYQSALNMPQKLLSQSDAKYCSLFLLNQKDGVSLQQLHDGSVLTNRDVFRFLVLLISSLESREFPSFEVLDDIRKLVQTVKPAHTLFDLGIVTQEDFPVDLGENALYLKAKIRESEFWGHKVDLVLNPPYEIHTDMERVDGQEKLNNAVDGFFTAGPFISEHNLYFPVDMWHPRTEEHAWKTMEDLPPAILCFGVCESSCQDSCESMNCEFVCESTEQMCYTCQVHCVLACQELCELHLEQYDALPPDTSPCDVACQLAAEYGACTTFCEVNCQVGCELPCQTSCQVSCQVDCVDACLAVLETCSLSYQNPCLSTDQFGCENILQGCSIGCEVSCQVDCEVNCQVGCEVSCETYCMQTCQTVEELSCVAVEEGGECSISCQLTCEKVCESPCQTACQGGCESPYQWGLNPDLGLPEDSEGE